MYNLKNVRFLLSSLVTILCLSFSSVNDFEPQINLSEEKANGCSLFEDLLPVGIDSVLKFNAGIQGIALNSKFDQRQGLSLMVVACFNLESELKLSTLRVYDRRRSVYDTATLRKNVELFYHKKLEEFSQLEIKPVDTCSFYVHLVKLSVCT